MRRKCDGNRATVGHFVWRNARNIRSRPSISAEREGFKFLVKKAGLCGRAAQT